MTSFPAVAGYGVLCSVSMLAGNVLGRWWRPDARAKSYLQHVAAGFVFAAAAVEVLPDVMHRGQPLAAALGFAGGLALTLSIQLLSKRFGGGGAGATAFVAVVVADIFIDGLLIGVAATASSSGQLGLLIAIAVAVELLSLGLSLAATTGEASRVRSLTTGTITTAAPLLGAVVGYFLGGLLGAGWIEAVLAFAVAVFLYMAAEELLREAHEAEETPLGTALLFAAFLVMMILDMVMS